MTSLLIHPGYGSLILYGKVSRYCGIVVVVVIANEVSPAKEETICKRCDFTTIPLGLQDKKENQ
jgi:hypothetical protein